jgi:hypothetical protein
MPRAVRIKLCDKIGAEYWPMTSDQILSISKEFSAVQFPINGLRHPPTVATSGWYIWSGEILSANPEFFVPMHASHLAGICPEAIKYLGLAAGWRFLFAPDYEDVWRVASLLRAQ